MKAHITGTPARPFTTTPAVSAAGAPSPVRPESAGAGTVVVTWAEYQRRLPMGSPEMLPDGRQTMPEAGEPVARSGREVAESAAVLGFIYEPMS